MAFAILDFEFDTHLYISLIIKKPSYLFFFVLWGSHATGGPNQFPQLYDCPIGNS